MDAIGHFHGNFNHSKSFFSCNQVPPKTRHQQFLPKNTSQWAKIYWIPEKTWAPLKYFNRKVDKHAGFSSTQLDRGSCTSHGTLSGFQAWPTWFASPMGTALSDLHPLKWSEAMHLLAMNGTKPLLVTQLAHSKETNYTYAYIHSLQASERQKTHGTPSSILFLGAQIHCIISLVTLSGGSRLVSDIL